ncbi:MAG TPA: class I SAM-dependent methyltransferase [Anaerolineales bacterium]|nr:class I SAM-dependent methyltransferase [Anaerolineales bacterium]
MHHHHPPTTVNHTHNRPTRQKMVNMLMEHLHDTELWANYLPRIPRRLYLLAFLGIGLIVAAFAMFRNGQTLLGGIGFGLSVLFIVPLILMGLFVRWKRNRSLELRRQILDSILWRGDEKVLDVGCGNGLLLNGAAMRLTGGEAIGIDIWADHGGGGTQELLWRNARVEKVADKIEFREVDARKMPFERATFDVVVSSGAMHHISRTPADFDQALHEMIRVLKPGGQIVIADVAHMVNACASRMRPAGVGCEVKETGRFLGYEMGIVFGTKVG